MSKTIGEWFVPIISIWKFEKNNVITEGFHRKMKQIQRMAYVYKNFENNRLRAHAQCGIFHCLWLWYCYDYSLGALGKCGVKL